MRRAAILLSLLLLAGCNDEPDFETRYDKAAAEIDARAKAIDADIAEANAADRAVSEPLPAAPPASSPPRSPGT